MITDYKLWWQNLGCRQFVAIISNILALFVIFCFVKEISFSILISVLIVIVINVLIHIMIKNDPVFIYTNGVVFSATLFLFFINVFNFIKKSTIIGDVPSAIVLLGIFLADMLLFLVSVIIIIEIKKGDLAKRIIWLSCLAEFFITLILASPIFFIKF